MHFIIEMGTPVMNLRGSYFMEPQDRRESRGEKNARIIHQSEHASIKKSQRRQKCQW
jgi:hypothetical protein